MSKLESYYNHRATIANGGTVAQLNSQAWENLEDRLIREEILPELMERIAPVLAKVQSALSINISYNPEGTISLNFTRNCLQMQIPAKGKTYKTETTEDTAAAFAEEDVTLDVSEPVVDDEEDTAESEEETIVAEANVVRKKSKSIGFTVTFGDGTVIHEKKAVQTWKKTLQKIGLDNIINNQKKHDAWHTVDGKNICIVDRVETVRSSDNASPQEYIDGYYVMTQLSNIQKVKDIESLGRLWPKLKMRVTWDEAVAEKTVAAEDVQQEVLPKSMPKINEEAKYFNLPIKEQAWQYMSKQVAERTANSYISVLENPVRRFINEKIDSDADSVFSYTTTDDVELVISMLLSDDEFKTENESRHNSMSAALNKYLEFIKSRE